MSARRRQVLVPDVPAAPQPPEAIARQTRSRAPLLLFACAACVAAVLCSAASRDVVVERARALLLSPSTRLISHAQLARRNGSLGDPIWLAICGQVFDVTKGRKHYGPGGGYSFFSGRDGSRAFVSGDFTEEGLVESVAGLTEAELAGLAHWQDFYAKDYTFLGRLADSAFYDARGAPLPPVALVQSAARAVAQEREALAASEQAAPPCSASWTAEQGGRVWCTASGLVPRRMVAAATQHTRCACVKAEHSALGLQDAGGAQLHVYDGCDAHSQTCSTAAPAQSPALDD